MELLWCFVVVISVREALCYWEKDRQNTEDPQFDVSTCDDYCRLMPAYMNWRAMVDYRERAGFSFIRRSTEDGTVQGISVPGVHDTNSFVSMFLGIPYAKPPVKEDAFKHAQPYPNGFDSVWDATYYRPACPQIEDVLQDDIPRFSYTNADCLYINVFQPNRTDEANWQNTYPVMVFIHGGGFKKGSAIQYPGIILAQRDMIVVTFNYRLGPLGFLSTGDGTVPGNMGLSDQLMALQWVQKNIKHFRGDPSRVTLIGHEAGAACVGMHMISSLSRNLFSRAILMSGSDLSPWAFITNRAYAREYAIKLSEILGCGSIPGDSMVRCLRNKHPNDFSNAAEKVPIKRDVGETAGPFAPTIDNYFFSDTPANIRKNIENILKIDILTGFSKDEGAWIVAKNFSQNFSNIMEGVSLEEFHNVVRNVTIRRGARHVQKVQDSIEFLYTWWPDPDNSTARRRMLIDLFTDELYASGVDSAIKSHLRLLSAYGKNTYMYKFDYRSKVDNSSTYWMGAYHNYDVQYLFGWPYLAINRTYQQLSGIIMNKTYNELDRNVSNATMKMWKDFAMFGNPTQYVLDPIMPWNFRNMTWYYMNVSNLTYFQMSTNSSNQREYHQSQLAFWQDYIYDILRLEPYTTTPIYRTTFSYTNYQIATYSLSAMVAIGLLIMLAMIVALSKLALSKRPLVQL